MSFQDLDDHVSLQLPLIVNCDLQWLSKWYPMETITDLDYADDLALLVYTSVLTK